MDSDQLGASEWREPQQYDAITCMFAIHYFFVSQAALHRFMENVSLNLKDGKHARSCPLCCTWTLLCDDCFPMVTVCSRISNLLCHTGVLDFESAIEDHEES